MNIFLIGYRCTGKTSVGMTIANKINWRFVDADTSLVEEAGKTVAEIVLEGGWDLFRDLEKGILRKICQFNNQVVATGGGVVLAPENIEQMKNNGVIIWLYAEPLSIYKRMKKDGATPQQRPALTDQNNIMKEIEDTLLERIPLYKYAMDYEITTEGKDIATVRGEALTLLKSNHIINI
jgi:shikimate kinase